MADVVKTETTLKIDNVFVDGDTRSFSLKNPRNNLTSNDITALNVFMQTNNIIIGDKAGGTFGKIKTATIIQKQNVTLDISGQ